MKKVITVFVISMLFISTGGSAQEKGMLELRSTAEVEVEVVNKKGEKEITRVEVAKVVPGDEVIFTTYYRNIGKEPAEDVVITNPVPEHMAYKDFSVTGKETTVTFSVDGGKSYGTQDMLKVVDPEGKERRAMASDYTDIRWTFDRALQPDEEGSVSFRAILK